MMGDSLKTLSNETTPDLNLVVTDIFDCSGFFELTTKGTKNTKAVNTKKLFSYFSGGLCRKKLFFLSAVILIWLRHCRNTTGI